MNWKYIDSTQDHFKPAIQDLLATCIGTRLLLLLHPFNGPFSGTTRVSRYQKGKTRLDFTEARDSEWQWHQLDHMQVCTSLQTDNHASTPPLSFLQAGCPSCHPTNSIKALKAKALYRYQNISKFYVALTNPQAFYFCIVPVVRIH